jgi:sec-independent protein translocase protein TatB
MDIGWSELLVIGIVALIVIGPKDLPRLFNTLGRFTAKARAMAREFQRAMDDAARESGVQEASAEIKAMLSKKSLGLDKVEAAARKFESWDPLKKPAAKPAAPPAPGSETAKLAEERAARAEAVRAAAGGTAQPATPPAAPAPSASAAGASAAAASAPAAEASAVVAHPAAKAPRAGKAREAAPSEPGPAPARQRATRKAAAKKSP